ncbi:hypothetical protein EGW08_005651 [Elysia chlorotica]|uniref:Uncharacterized protein n=1 Tax=Elysia chlorotica TaxID=188477 RepID=A0A3S0ZTW2_ELYCH|nr:hypothetical protein EGW08_005651 [Elysia chlorotica]
MRNLNSVSSLMMPLPQRLLVIIAVLLLCTWASNRVQARSTTSLQCNPREVKMSCIMGCYGCLKTFGVELYELASCCRDCRISNLDIIDDGPARCSSKYIRKSWLKRYG